MTLSSKDSHLRDLVERLKADLDDGYFVTIDHWDGDRLAVGLARPDNPGVLVYVAVTPGSDTIFFECEVPSDPYEATKTQDNASYAELLAVVTAHLRPAST